MAFDSCAVSGLREESRIHDIRTFQPLKMRAMQFPPVCWDRTVLEERKPQVSVCENLKTRKGKIVSAVKQDSGGS